MPLHLRVTALHIISSMAQLFGPSHKAHYRNNKFSLPTAPSGLFNNNNKNTINLIIIINTNNYRTKL